jgi:hypothetical protein
MSSRAQRHPPRSCGACNFCCSVAGINDLEKPPMVRCHHLAQRPSGTVGCGIYPDRPKACADFACDWLAGNFDNRHRPDKIGAYVSSYPMPEGGSYTVVHCDSQRLNKKRLDELVAVLQRGVPEVRILYDAKHGTIMRRGEKPQRFGIMPWAPGEYAGRI